MTTSLDENAIKRYALLAEGATAANVLPFGQLVGAAPGVPALMSWPGTEIFGPIPLILDADAELLVATVRKSEMRVTMIERHYQHTQTYLPLDGRPFIMVLGEPNDAEMPDLNRLRALRFEQACGIALHTGVWHAFPFAVEEVTHFAVILRAEAHVNTLTEREVDGDAEGPDLFRRVIRSDVLITVIEHARSVAAVSAIRGSGI